MKLKTNLHFHTKEDDEHALSYTLREGIDHAVSLGFDVLAVTCHGTVVATEGDIAYARTKGLLLISGIEANIKKDSDDRGRHTLILNVTKEVEALETFDELRAYKQAHPEICIIAPHPYYYGGFSLHEHLEPNIDLFDAIEDSWFYSQQFNRNHQARAVAQRHHKPLVATSDTHFLDFMNEHYCLIEAQKKTPESVFAAIRNNHITNITTERSFLKDMVWRWGWFTLIDETKKIIRFLQHS